MKLTVDGVADAVARDVLIAVRVRDLHHDFTIGIDHFHSILCWNILSRDARN